jgi:iron complex outermembrane receptor protein
MTRIYLLTGAAVPCLLLAASAGAQTRDVTSEERTDATIVVTGQRDPLKLNDQA